MELLVFVYLDLIMGIRRIFGSEQIFEVFMGGGGVRGQRSQKESPTGTKKEGTQNPERSLKIDPHQKKLIRNPGFKQLCWQLPRKRVFIWIQ